MAKILLIEDDNMLADMYAAKFTREGYNVLQAENGAKGLKMVKDEKPDIVLLDIIMPKMDGFSCLKSIRRHEETKSIPVILLTNLGQEEDIKKGQELGADGYYIKANHTPTEIVEKVKEVLGTK